MIHRTTFSLDETTISHLRQLSLLWHIPQAEVVRKAIDAVYRAAESSENLEVHLDTYLNKGGLNAEVADQYLNEVAENRTQWREPS